MKRSTEIKARLLIAWRKIRRIFSNDGIQKSRKLITDLNYDFSHNPYDAIKMIFKKDFKIKNNQK